MPPEDLGTDPTAYNINRDADRDDTNETRSRWLRGFHMLVFFILFSIGQTLLSIITVFQFLSLLISGHPNQRLSDFGGTLALWLADVAAFQTCVTDDKPFPWAPWPSETD